MSANTFVILAAGKGERLWPITESTPKCMARILGKPLLEWTIDAVEKSAKKIVLVTGYKRELIERHFKNKPYAQKIVYATQENQEGTAHALMQAEKFVSGDFVVLNGDNFFSQNSFDQILEETKKPGYFAFAKKVDDCKNFGVFTIKNGEITGFKEKPAEGGPGLANLNLFKAGKNFFEHLKKVKLSPRGELELPDAIFSYAKENKMRPIELEGYFNDIGFFWNYIDANAYACKHETKFEIQGQLEEGVIVKGKIFVGKGSVIKAPCRIEGPVFIGETCTIGPNAFIRAGTVVENNCHIGSSEVKNSVLLEGANAPHFSYVGDSVLCEEVNLGAGTKIANLRFDDANITVMFPTTGKAFDSAKRKLGTCIGAGTKIGVNASINCGTLIGSNCRILPGTVVKESLNSGQKK